MHAGWRIHLRLLQRSLLSSCCSSCCLCLLLLLCLLLGCPLMPVACRCTLASGNAGQPAPLYWHLLYSSRQRSGNMCDPSAGLGLTRASKMGFGFESSEALLSVPRRSRAMAIQGNGHCTYCGHCCAYCHQNDSSWPMSFGHHAELRRHQHMEATWEAVWRHAALDCEAGLAVIHPSRLSDIILLQTSQAGRCCLLPCQHVTGCKLNFIPPFGTSLHHHTKVRDEESV